MIRHNFKRIILWIAWSTMVAAQTAEPSAMDHLHRALHLADLYNWNGAAADFGAAEQMFDVAGDRRNALYAHFGKIRATATQRELPATSAQLASELEENPLVRTDKELRMFCLIVKGDIDGEIDSGAMRRDWEDVQALARDLGDAKWQNRSLGQLGMAAFYEGDLETARKNVGATLIAAMKTNDAGAQIRFLTVAGIGLHHTHMLPMALQYFDNALKIAAATPDAGYPFVTNESRLETLMDMGQIDAAQRLAEEIMAKAGELNLPEHQVVVLNLQAHLANARKETATAMRLFQQVVDLAGRSGLVSQLADAESQLAVIHRERGELEEAEHLADMAVASAQAAGNAWAIPSCLGLLGQIKVSRGQYAEGDEIYDRAGSFIDSMLGKYSGLPEKTALIKASSDLYTQHFSLVADQLHDAAKAYAIVEQVRGRAITDLLLAGSVTTDAAKKGQQTLSALRMKLMSARSAAETRKIRDQIFLVEQARWVTPDINILKAESHKTIGIDQVQHALGPSSAVLEYVLAEPKSYCLVISRGAKHIVSLVGQHQIEARAMIYLKKVKAKSAAQDEARLLYDTLLAPVQEARQKTDLVIIRDGLLNLLPFDAFADDSGHYVVENHTVVYSPSASAFILLRNHDNPSGHVARSLLAVGGIPYDRGELKRVATTRGYDESVLSDLPASKDEVLAADTALASPRNTVLLGAKATESAFKHSALGNYRILHLAVHGYASSTDSDQSALVMLSDASVGEDGLLHPAEIVQLKLHAALAILSACDTAVGPVQGEEGIETLSRAFLLAGARNVISTLWSVDDTFSLFLMRQFYQHLAANESAPTALVAAKRDMLRKYGTAAIPYYWAAYIIEGAFDGASRNGDSQERRNVTQSKRAN